LGPYEESRELVGVEVSEVAVESVVLLVVPGGGNL
jgi:hypothetical protein